MLISWYLMTDICRYWTVIIPFDRRTRKLRFHVYLTRIARKSIRTNFRNEKFMTKIMMN